MKKIFRVEQVEYTEAPKVDEAKVKRYMDLENKGLQLEAELKKMYAEQAILKQEIIDSLPGRKQDKVDINVEGILVSKTVQDKSKIDVKKAIDWARGRRLLNKVARKDWVIDAKAFESQVVKLIDEKKVSKEDIKELMEEKYVPMIKFKDTRPGIVNEGDQETTITIAK